MNEHKLNYFKCKTERIVTKAYVWMYRLPFFRQKGRLMTSDCCTGVIRGSDLGQSCAAVLLFCVRMSKTVSVHRSTGYRFRFLTNIKLHSGTRMRTICGSKHHFHNIIYGLWASPFSKKCQMNFEFLLQCRHDNSCQRKQVRNPITVCPIEFLNAPVKIIDIFRSLNISQCAENYSLVPFVWKWVHRLE